MTSLWHGHLPAGWTSEPLKRLTADGFRNGTWGSEPGESDHDVKCVRAADFDRTGLRVDPSKMPVRSVTAAEWRNRTLHPGDIVLEKSGGGDQQPVGKAVLFLLSDDAVCSNFQASARPARGVDSRYLTYALEAMYQTGVATCCIKQTTGLQNLDSGAYLTLATPRPPSRVQSLIAEHLDSETARIDALIDHKQRFIDLLLEKRTTLITHAVTKGLDPSVEMRDSGVRWIGSIPSHWDPVRIKRVARLESGHTPSRQHPEYWIDCTVPWITTSEVWQVRDGRAEFITETKEKVSELGLAHSSARKLPAGTVVLSRTASVGFSAIMREAMATSQDFADWVPGPRVTSEYLLYTFRSMRSEFDRLMMGSTHQTIYMPDIQKLEMPLPPRDEQRAIVEYVRCEARLIDALVDKSRCSIDLLREYRTALISAAVTGQIDIPSTETSEDVA